MTNTENKFARLAKSPSAFADKKPVPLVHDLFYEQSLNLIYSKTGGMKSWLMYDLARAIVTGDTFLGYQAEQQRVLYLDAEQGDYVIHGRLSTMNLMDADDHLIYITQGDEAFDFSEEDDQKEFIAYIKQSGLRIIIFDNLRTMLSVTSENDSAQFTIINNFLKQLRNLGCTVFMVHHANKDSANYAGSSNIATIYNSIIGLHDSPTKTDGYRVISVEKDRDSMSGLAALNQQYISLTGDRFSVNNSTGLERFAIADALAEALKQLKLKNQGEIKSFLRSVGMTFSNNEMDTRKIIDLLGESSIPHEYRSNSDLRDCFTKAKALTVEVESLDLSKNTFDLEDLEDY